MEANSLDLPPHCMKKALHSSPPFGPAFLARLVTCVTGLAEGYDIGVISGVLVLMRKEVVLTPQEVGAIVGALYFAMALGAPVGGTLADAVGRKKSLAASYAGLIVGCIAMSMATGFKVLLLGRIILGVAIGGGLCIVTTYMAELSPKKHRGWFVCLEDMFLVIGVTVGYAANYLLAELPNDWRWMLALGVGPALAALLLLMLPQLPESPRWMMLHGRGEDASRALAALVGEEEAAQMLAEWREQKVSSWGELLCPSARWRLAVVVAGAGVMATGMLSGISMVSVYTGAMLAEGLSEDQAFLLTTALGFFRVLVLLVSIFFVLDAWGRRPLLMLSAGSVVVSTAALAYLYKTEAAILPLKYLALMAYSVAVSFGLGPVSFVYGPEVFPTDIRSKGVALGTSLARVCAGALSFAFPTLREVVGVGGVFAMLAVINTGSLIFIFLCVPETAGESLEEMHHLFRREGRPAAGPPP